MKIKQIKSLDELRSINPGKEILITSKFLGENPNIKATILGDFQELYEKNSSRFDNKLIVFKNHYLIEEKFNEKEDFKNFYDKIKTEKYKSYETELGFSIQNFPKENLLKIFAVEE